MAVGKWESRVLCGFSKLSVGHLGTLDPMATGVLTPVLGRFTRLAQFFKDSSKFTKERSVSDSPQTHTTQRENPWGLSLAFSRH